ncbi:MAG TPA: DUF2165 family protein [Nevskiaceae bacterium]|nr:DUF2165 family protein [Nevskiaceae bacterium]
MRGLQIAAASLIGAMGLLFCLGNAFNLPFAYGAVASVLSGAEQPYYKSVGPTFDAPWLQWLALGTIMSGELCVGLLGIYGSWRMLRRRAADATTFQAAKPPAIAAGAVGMLLWYGVFVVIGEGYFFMWTDAAVRSVEGGFRYGTVCAVLMLFIRGEADR